MPEKFSAPECRNRLCQQEFPVGKHTVRAQRNPGSFYLAKSGVAVEKPTHRKMVKKTLQ